MTEIIQKIIATLIADSTLTTLVPVKNILTGPVDIVTETQTGLVLPQINVHIVSEVSRTVPLNVRDTMVQIDIWSRNSQLEVSTIYDRIIFLLNYLSGDQGQGHFFWERLGSAVDMYEQDRRIFHRACTFVVWSQKS